MEESSKLAFCQHFYGKAVATLLAIFTLVAGLYYLVFDIDVQRCEMTYMYDYPRYFKVYESTTKEIFRNYAVYHYLEEHDPNEFKGFPILFIPGNAGSYKQVRSLASVSKQMSIKHGNTLKFNYFTIDFGEELSGFNGRLLEKQALFVQESINKIQNLYRNNKIPIILIGHSVGGFLARAAVALKTGQNIDDVKLIVALASPLEIPVLGSDRTINDLYDFANYVWATEEYKRVPIVSLTGGNRDALVHDVYGSLNISKSTLWRPIRTINRCGMSADHLCIVWCRQVVILINKVLFSMLPQYMRMNHNHVLESFKSHLFPPLLQDKSVDYVLNDSYIFLFFEKIIQISEKSKYRITLKSLSMITRPVRVKITSKDCKSTYDIKMTLVTPSNGQQMQFDQSLIESPGALLYLSQSIKKNEQSAYLHIDRLNPLCHYDIIFGASVLDWAAYVLRVNMGRILPVTSSLLVAQCTYVNYKITSVLLMTIASIIFAVGFEFPSTLHNLISSGHLDAWDLVLMLMPMAYSIVIVISVLASALSTIFSSGHKFKLSKFSIFLLVTLPYMVVQLTMNQGISRSMFIFVFLFSLFLSRVRKTEELVIILSLILCVSILELPSVIGLVHSKLTRHSWQYVLLHDWWKQAHTLLLLDVASVKTMLMLILPATLTLLQSTKFRNRAQGDGFDGSLKQPFIMKWIWLLLSPLTGCACLLYGVVDLSYCRDILLLFIMAISLFIFIFSDSYTSLGSSNSSSTSNISSRGFRGRYTGNNNYNDNSSPRLSKQIKQQQQQQQPQQQPQQQQQQQQPQHQNLKKSKLKRANKK